MQKNDGELICILMVLVVTVVWVFIERSTILL